MNLEKKHTCPQCGLGFIAAVVDDGNGGDRLELHFDGTAEPATGTDPGNTGTGSGADDNDGTAETIVAAANEPGEGRAAKEDFFNDFV